MKLSRLVLRWYKSFHLNYRGNPESRGESKAWRPWNNLVPDFLKEGDFPFIEIPIEEDITTIVGANESGKSHLLNAISKVVSGRGLLNSEPFRKTDLCHYASIRTKNIEASPQIGLVFSVPDPAVLQKLVESAGQTIGGDVGSEFAIIVEPLEDGQEQAWLYVSPSNQAHKIASAQLAAIRRLLPKVNFIDSHAQLSSEIPVTQLLAAYGKAQYSGLALRDRRSVEDAAGKILALAVPSAEKPVGDLANSVAAIKQSIKLSDINSKLETLEVLLFKSILGISDTTIEYLYKLPVDARGFVEGQISKWNEEIDEKLNLSHFWRQDEQFTLRMNYKDGIIYFEIQDKTDSIYTFRERSSGLKYFLSYYIQARALEAAHLNQNSIILMDEPDSALSVMGQRNLLSVFESLVRPEMSTETCQLVYTTHSPSLINRNFPRRVRVVKKEDAEEGTQFIENARARRYEPVRTALGMDSTQTLFMGSANLLLEGVTDQYILVEAIRKYSSPDNLGTLLDLNYLSVVSAEGVNNIDKVLERSQWADEPLPPTVVLLDGDKAGTEAKDQITGKVGKKLIAPEFVVTVPEMIAPFGRNKHIATIEDVVPRSIYGYAIFNYCRKWLPHTFAERSTEALARLQESSFGTAGLVESTKAFFAWFQPTMAGDFDKLGVFQEVVLLLEGRVEDAAGLDLPSEGDYEEFKSNILKICECVREKLELSRAKVGVLSAAQAVKR